MIVKPIKPYQKIRDLIHICKARGLVINNEPFMEDCLKSVGYYRLSGYSLTFRDPINKDDFIAGTKFEDIWNIYKFDYELRALILKYTDPIEVHLRNSIAHYHSKSHTPLGYLDSSHFRDSARHTLFLTKLQDSIQKSSKYLFVQHHINQYGGKFPVWAAVELTTLSCLSQLYKNMTNADKKAISTEYYGYNSYLLGNWLHGMSTIRNIAAHRGRLYYRSIPVQIQVPNTHKGYGIKTNRVFAHIILIKKLLRPCLRKKFESDFVSLMTKYSGTSVNVHHLGCPINWQQLISL